MSIGYPDFARLSQAGGVLFTSNNNPIANNQTVFQGYVGDHPYITTFINSAGANDFIQLQYIWCSDATFNTIVAFKYQVRQTNNISWVQYANFSPWLKVFAVTKSGNPFPSNSYSLYGTTAPTPQVGLASLDVPILHNSSLIAASTAQQFLMDHVQPGNALFSYHTTAASWFVEFQYYDYGSNSTVNLNQITNNQYPNGQFITEMPFLDCPMYVNVNNGDTSARTFIFSWMSK